MCRLLSGFEAPEELKDKDPVCSISETIGSFQFDIVNFSPSFAATHMMTSVTDMSAILMCNEAYTESSVFAPFSTDEIKMEMVLTAFYSRLAFLRTVLVHASLVEMPGLGGVMFVGRSGIGKTTQARLWEQFRGATIINGDKVFLSLNEERDTVSAHGSPWCGSSPYKLNQSTTLKGIIVLDQAKENTIRRLDDFEVLGEYVPHIFMPMWDEKATDAVMDTIDGMLPNVPVFKLACRPDEEAVDMTFRAVFGNAD